MIFSLEDLIHFDTIRSRSGRRTAVDKPGPREGPPHRVPRRPTLSPLRPSTFSGTMATVAPTTKKGGLSQVSMIFACGTALFSDGYANSIIGSGTC
jgi:hypothetical protein